MLQNKMKKEITFEKYLIFSVITCITIYKIVIGFHISFIKLSKNVLMKFIQCACLVWQCLLISAIMMKKFYNTYHISHEFLQHIFIPHYKLLGFISISHICQYTKGLLKKKGIDQCRFNYETLWNIHTWRYHM